MPICFNQLIIHGSYLFHTPPPPFRLRPPLPYGLSLRTYNIRNGWGFGLTQAIRVVQIGGFDIIILTDTKITDQAYFRNRLGYNMGWLPEITATAGNAQGGAGLVIQEWPQG